MISIALKTIYYLYCIIKFIRLNILKENMLKNNVKIYIIINIININNRTIDMLINFFKYIKQ